MLIKPRTTAIKFHELNTNNALTVEKSSMNTSTSGSSSPSSSPSAWRCATRNS